jgi:Peptidase A4 family
LPISTIVGVNLGRIAAAVAVTAAVGAAAPLAGAGARKPATDISENWAGYTVADTAAKPVVFTKVTATWQQPVLTCGAGDSRSAIWVGLGGVNPDSGELDQLGTNASCTAGKPQYNAFYDLIPDPGAIVKRFAIRAGDVITATVTTDKAGTVARFRMENLTSKIGFAGAIPVQPGARRSAEWIIEAPEGCDGALCGQADLANFGSVAFTKVSAIGNGAVGTILDPSWHATAESLTPPRAQISATGLSHGAVPRALAADGGSFKVVWRAHTVPVAPPDSKPAPVKKPPSVPYVAGPFSR